MRSTTARPSPLSIVELDLLDLDCGSAPRSPGAPNRQGYAGNTYVVYFGDPPVRAGRCHGLEQKCLRQFQVDRGRLRPRGVVPPDLTGGVLAAAGYHDMGLLLGAIMPILAGVLTDDCPVGFLHGLADRWMALLARRGAHFGGTINSGDGASDVEPNVLWTDLTSSALHTILNGSEAVTPATLKRFVNGSAALILPPRRCGPLAEATLATRP